MQEAPLLKRVWLGDFPKGHKEHATYMHEWNFQNRNFNVLPLVGTETPPKKKHHRKTTGSDHRFNAQLCRGTPSAVPMRSTKAYSGLEKKCPEHRPGKRTEWCFERNKTTTTTTTTTDRHVPKSTSCFETLWSAVGISGCTRVHRSSVGVAEPSEAGATSPGPQLDPQVRLNPPHTHPSHRNGEGGQEP